jgi:putative transcriptional regulator
MVRLLCMALLLALGSAPGRLAAQSKSAADLHKGKLLVASRELPDPNFAKTVILLVDYSADGVVGLILNRRSTIPISRALDELRAAKNRPDPVYAGGPVGENGVLALLRSSSPPGDAQRVLADVYLVANKDLLEKTVASTTDPKKFRVYLGYAGWTEPQLENEVNLGAWFIFQGTAAAVFDNDPDSLWTRLIHETEMQIARR